MKYGLRFVERMSGWVCIDAGPRMPFEIQVHVFRGCAIRGFALFQLATVNAPLVEGALSISPRGVGYDFNVDGGEFGKLRVVGSKSYRWNLLRPRQFIRSLIELPVEISRDGKKVGHGMLVYREPLWKFALSMRVVREENAFEQHLSFARRILALSRILVPNHAARADGDQPLQNILLQLRSTGSGTRILLAVGCRLMLLLSSLFKSDQNAAAFFSRVPILKNIAHTLGVIGLSSIYCGKKEAVSVADEQNSYDRQHHHPSAALEELEADVVVVGSGAGGAAAAYALAAAGFAVALVEEGAYFKRKDFGANRIEMMARLYRSGGMSFPISNAPLWLPTGKTVGGTTTVNCGTCMRPTAQTLASWERELGIPSAEWEPYFAEAERVYAAKQVPDHLHGPIRGILEKGLEGKAELRPLMRAEEGCDGQASCIFGCPTDAKRSTNVSFIPEMLKNNGLLLTGYRVDGFIKENDRVLGITAAVSGYGDEFRLRIRARVVLLAAGTLQTPLLLNKSKIIRGNRALGRGLSIHPALNVGALFDRPVRPEHYVPQSLAFNGLDEGVMYEGHTLSADEIPLVVPVFGEALTRIMDQSAHYTNFAAMLSDTSLGRLLFLRDSEPVILYHFDARALRRIHAAVLRLAEIFFKAGARQVLLPVRGFEIISSESELACFAKATPRGLDYFALSGHHPLGTCRMGATAKNSVIDPSGRVWGVPGLRVVDGSAIPGPLGTNPQMTITANALRIADLVKKELS